MVQNRKTGPLPEDVTAEQLRARQKQPAASARQDSTNNQYAATSQKWWPMFLKAAQWDANDKAHWLDADGKPRDGIFRQLFIWLYEQDVSKSIFKTMLATRPSGAPTRAARRRGRGTRSSTTRSSSAPVSQPVPLHLSPRLGLAWAAHAPKGRVAASYTAGYEGPQHVCTQETHACWRD